VGAASPLRGRLAALLAVVLASLVAAPAGIAAAQGAGDPYRDQQWNLDRLRVEQAWAVSRGAGAVVAVVDTGVALDHPDLVDRFLRRDDGSIVGLDLVDEGGDAGDEHGHGTLVAGVIAATADDGHGIAGVAPLASIVPIRVLDQAGAGRSEDVGRAIRWAADRGADVINVSLEAVGGEDGAERLPGVPDDAVRYADERGAVVVAAAGNRPGAAASYPEDSPIVLVGGVDRDDDASRFATVDRPDGLVAPGVEIVSTWCRRTPDGCDVASSPYGLAEGTSFAAPHVSGVAALLAATGLDAPAIRERLLADAVDLGAAGPDRTYGAGRVDAAASLGFETAGRTPAPTPPAPDDPSAPAPAPAPAVPTVPSEEPSGEEVVVTDPPPDDGPVGADADGDPEPVDGAATDVASPPAPSSPTPVTLEARSEVSGASLELPWLEGLATLLVALSLWLWSAIARTEV
jgi:subtilisin family serine protease